MTYIEKIKIHKIMSTKQDWTFEGICQSMIDVYKKKNSDYGNSFTKGIEKYGNIHFVGRAFDKFNRMEELLLSNKPAQVTDEKVTDTLLDLANYCVMMIEYLKSKNADETIKCFFSDAQNTKGVNTSVSVTEK